MDSTSMQQQSIEHRKPSEMIFSQLANLPKPIIPKIDLGIQRMDLTSMMQFTTRSSLALHRKVGYSMQDRTTQTEQSDIVDLHYGIDILQTLMQDAGHLRKDLNFAVVTLKANYEQQIRDHSTQLYCRINDKVKDLEGKYQIKMDQLRKTYQTQLDNAIRQIAGQYKAYYDELLHGKTGRHDLVIKNLKEQVAEKDVLLRTQEVQIETLESKLKELEKNENVSKTPIPPSGITQEEADKLYEQLNELESELNTCKTDMASKEDENRKLKRKIDNLNGKLEDQDIKYKQLKKDMEDFKEKTKREQEKSARMAENQLASLEKQMKEQMEAASREAALKAQEQAEMQRLRDQAKYKEEMDKRRLVEDQLRTQAQKKPDVLGDNELLAQIEKLQKIEQQQKREISKLRRELERTNKVWELKMAVIKKNFHALKDEFHLRHTLERQSVQLHHATVGYASSGTVQDSQPTDEEKLLSKSKTPPHSSSLSSCFQSNQSPLATSVMTRQAISANSKNVHFKEVRSQGRSISEVQV